MSLKITESRWVRERRFSMEPWKGESIDACSMLSPKAGDGSGLGVGERGGGARVLRGSAGSVRIPLELLKRGGFRVSGMGVA